MTLLCYQLVLCPSRPWKGALLRQRNPLLRRSGVVCENSHRTPFTISVAVLLSNWVSRCSIDCVSTEDLCKLLHHYQLGKAPNLPIRLDLVMKILHHMSIFLLQKCSSYLIHGGFAHWTNGDRCCGFSDVAVDHTFGATHASLAWNFLRAKPKQPRQQILRDVLALVAGCPWRSKADSSLERYKITYGRLCVDSPTVLDAQRES